MTALRYRAETAFFRLALAVARAVPRSWMLRCGRCLGLVGYYIDGRHRRTTLDNLQSVYGDELSASQRSRLARKCWQLLGRNIFDALYFPSFSADSVDSLVHYEGLSHIRQAYARGKGVLLFSGHFGNWELTALMQGFLGLPLVLITRPLDNPDLERLLASLRSRSGNRIVHKRNAVRPMIQAVREGLGVAIVIDQDALTDGIFVPFLGRPASTTPTLARIALRTGAAVVPTFCIPQPDGTYRVVYEPEVEVKRSGDHNRDVAQLTTACTEIIERWVLSHPEHWLWMHRRWKTSPPTNVRGTSTPPVAAE